MPTRDAGWPVMQLAADALTETVYPSFWAQTGFRSATAIGNRVFFSGGGGPLVEWQSDHWQTLHPTVALASTAVRPSPQGVQFYFQEACSTCAAECLDGGAALKTQLFGVVNIVCYGEGPLTMMSSFGQLGSLIDGGWRARSAPFGGFAGSTCTSLRDGSLLQGGARVLRYAPVGVDGGSKFETPNDSSNSYADFVETPFGLMAVGNPNGLNRFVDGGWVEVARSTVPADPWVRGMLMPDGGLLTVGFETLNFVTDGHILSWKFPRGTLIAEDDGITVAPDGTVWIAATFRNAGGDYEHMVGAYKLRQ